MLECLEFRHDRFLPHPFQFIYHPFIRRYVVYVTEKASLNKPQNTKKKKKFLVVLKSFCFARQRNEGMWKITTRSSRFPPREFWNEVLARRTQDLLLNSLGNKPYWERQFSKRLGAFPDVRKKKSWKYVLSQSGLFLTFPSTHIAVEWLIPSSARFSSSSRGKSWEIP
jgi:hypothetical protein